MKNEIIRIIEESHYKPEITCTDFQFTILLKPKEDSLEILKWQKNIGITDLEAVTRADKQFIDRMRLDSATEVFRKFYQDTYLEKSNE